MGKGFLTVKLFVADGAKPVSKMRVLIKDTYGKIIYDLTADKNGITRKVELETTDYRYSITPEHTQPRFLVYTVEVPFARGYRRVIVYGVQIFDTEISILPIRMHPALPSGTEEENTEEIIIPINHGVDDPKRQEESSDPTIQYLQDPKAAELPQASQFPRIVPANEVAIPPYITVHLGLPNAAARNVRLPFADYIKNVASSEIFPTWEDAAIHANILCQISFTLNRVYTLWYPSRGFDYDITNSTQFDQFFVEGRNIFENISRIVDEIFNLFLRREGRREPFFAQYCNGTTSICDGLSQWGSQYLAQQGYTTIQILHYYYPRDIQIVESNNFASNIGVYPGYPLRMGSSGDDVRRMQVYLNRISGNFYIPPVGFPDGVFGTSTRDSVIAFQNINSLIPDGIIGRSTWYAITKIYVGVRQLAELVSEGERIGIGMIPPTVTLSIGSRGPYVIELQFLLNFISEFYPSIPFVVEDGVFRDSTKRSVVEFQEEFGLYPDGIVGRMTWSMLYEVYWAINAIVFGMEPLDL